MGSCRYYNSKYSGYCTLDRKGGATCTDTDGFYGDRPAGCYVIAEKLERNDKERGVVSRLVSWLLR